MPESPPIPFDTPIVGRRQPGFGGRRRPYGPGAAAQQQRLGSVFGRLRAALENERLALTAEPEAAAPEYVLVFELAGEFDEFAAAVGRVGGLEYLAESLGDKFEDADTFAVVDPHTGARKAVRRELFVVASDERAAGELESLWAAWQRGESLPRGWGQWRTVFERLNVVRRWDDRDRLERTGALEVWATELRDRGNELVPFETELWYRGDPARREAEQERLANDLRRVGGGVLAAFLLPEIRYHGVLGEAPASVLGGMAHTVRAQWLTGDGVRFFRAMGQTSFPVDDDDTLEPAPPRSPPNPTSQPPRAALLDGVPLAGHDLLVGRLVIDDADGWEELSQVSHRRHGTAMASAIIHGDLEAGEAPLDEPLYVRPILLVDPAHAWVSGPEETMPVGRLAVEVLHEAVARMFAGTEPRAPRVRIINLSVADRAQVYDRFMSPLARLLDYLSATYQVLFIVSAGNHVVDFAIDDDVDITDPAELASHIIGQLARTAARRRLLAPAESVNALTVGAAHSDASTPLADDLRLDLLTTPNVPSVSSAWGTGHGRAIKPDVLAPGGRELYDLQPVTSATSPRQLTPNTAARPPGIRVATPGRGGDLGLTSWTRGTSPAAALVTRAGVRILQRLDDLRALWGPDMPDDRFDAVLIKALLVHGATWSSGADIVQQAMQDAGLPATKEDVQRALGYGLIRPQWPLIDDTYRVTAIAATYIGDAEHEYRLPLPPSLARQTIWRRISITLAWLTPINPAHRGYRRAVLRVDPAGPALTPNRQEASNQAVHRGTVQHELLDGDRAVVFADDADLILRVSGRPGAGTLDEEVPYALVVTLETPEDVRVPVYAEVSARLRLRARTRV